jgi:DnaD/phage-associated family protein
MHLGYLSKGTREMADRKFVLPGTQTITMNADAAEKLLSRRNGDAALLYIYILKNNGAFSEEEAAPALGRTPEQIETAMGMLASMGLVELPDRLPRPVQRDELPEYSVEDIKREMENGAAFPALVQDVQRALGRLLSSDDLVKLFGIYDAQGLPPEVILLLVNHCGEACRRKYGERRPPTMRFIEKAAYTWEREELFTMEKAEEYISKMAKRREESTGVKAVLHIRDRELTPGEQKYVSSWLDMGFGPEAIEIAYDKTVLQTGKLAWNYMNSILRNWHAAGFHTPGEIDAGEGKRAEARKNVVPMQQGGSSPTAEDLERMKNYLKKLKEG